jgi:hypothetical protein
VSFCATQTDATPRSAAKKIRKTEARFNQQPGPGLGRTHPRYFLGGTREFSKIHHAGGQQNKKRVLSGLRNRVVMLDATADSSFLASRVVGMTNFVWGDYTTKERSQSARNLEQ